MGGEFIAIHMLPDNSYYSGAPWIQAGPYRLNKEGFHARPRPVFYGGPVNLSGNEFFLCLSEIRDDGGYEWYPDSNIPATTARGIRHLRRSFNSMVLASLFTHEYYLVVYNEQEWRSIISEITSTVAGFNPEYTTTDYAARYIRAKTNIKISNVVETVNNLEITLNGINDMGTKCMIFTEQNGQVISRYVDLPQVNGNQVITILK